MRMTQPFGQNTAALPGWTRPGAARSAAPSAWLPASWTRNTRSTASNDSKKLTEKKREALFDEIIEKALAYKIVFVGPEIIDRDNILNATMGGMRQAVEELDIVPNLVLIDGNRTPAGLTMPAQPVVKGDATSASIGAASVLAKVSRDRYMLELDRQYPQYQLAKHKGYPTKLHYD